MGAPNYIHAGYLTRKGLFGLINNRVYCGLDEDSRKLVFGKHKHSLNFSDSIALADVRLATTNGTQIRLTVGTGKNITYHAATSVAASDWVEAIKTLKNKGDTKKAKEHKPKTAQENAPKTAQEHTSKKTAEHSPKKTHEHSPKKIQGQKPKKPEEQEVDLTYWRFLGGTLKDKGVSTVSEKTEKKKISKDFNDPKVVDLNYYIFLGGKVN